MPDAPAFTPPLLAAVAAVGLMVALAAYRRPWTAPAAVAFFAPFAWYHTLGPVLVTLSKAVTIAGAAGLAAGILADPCRRKKAGDALRANGALLLLAGFALLALASIGWAGDRALALRDALKWWWYAAAFAMSAVAVRSSTDSMKFAGALFASSAITGVYGFWQQWAGTPIVFRAPDGSLVGRLVSTFEGPNQFGAYLETVIPLLLAVLLFARLPRLAFVGLSLLLGLLVSDVLLTYSRGAFWSSAAAIVSVASAYIWTRRNADAATLAALPKTTAAVAACAALVLLPAIDISATPSGWHRQFASVAAMEETQSVQLRLRLWECAESIFAAHPVVGVGAGNFAVTNAGCNLPVSTPWRSHANELYLEILADLGLVGFALFAGFFITLCTRVFSPEAWWDPVAIGALAALFAFALHGFVDDVMPYPKAALAFFTLLGLIPYGRTNQHAHESAL